MTSISTQGIVLRKVQYKGSSAIATIYTKRHGMVPFMVRGVTGRGKNPRASSLELLTRVEVGYEYREKADVQLLQTISLNPDASFPADQPAKIAIGMFLAEMLFRTLREESPDNDLFIFIDQSLEVFTSAPFNPDFHLVFLIRLSRFCGFYPSGVWSDSTPLFDLFTGQFAPHGSSSVHSLDAETSLNLYGLMETSYEGGDKLLSNTQRRKLLDALVKYFRLHLDGMGHVKSLDVLVEVFT